MFNDVGTLKLLSGEIYDADEMTVSADSAFDDVELLDPLFLEHDVVVDEISNEASNKETDEASVRATEEFSINSDLQLDQKVIVVAEYEINKAVNKSVDYEYFYSPLSGVIQKVFSFEKDIFKKGDPLFIIDVMKMEIEVVAEQDGVVSACFISKNERVSLNQCLYKMEYKL